MGERVGLGCTGPSERNDWAKSGSEASKLIASSREPLAWGLGRTVGPGWDCAAGGGGACRAALDAAAGAEDVFGALVGYWRAAEPAARDAFDADAPIVCCMWKDEDVFESPILIQ